MNKNEFPIHGQDFAAKESQPPEVKYALDINHTNLVHKERRATVSGEENTAIALAPARGCNYDCEFCSIKNINNPKFAVAYGQGGALAAQRVAGEIDALLTGNENIQTLKVFNAGNILYGTERRSGAEMNQAFWPALLEVLKKHPSAQALELEVRIDEFVGAAENQSGQQTPKGILRQRILWLDRELRQMGKQLRCILPLEYIESEIISQQSKFPPAFSNQGKSQANCLEAIGFMKQHGINWLSYAMLGGRLKDRPLTSEEASASAAHTTLFGLENGAREVIINSQYLDPINQWEEQRDGVNFYVPDEYSMVKTLELIISGLPQIPKIQGSTPRVRLTTDKEDTIVGTIGPQVSPEFRQQVLAFNNAPDQTKFFQTHFTKNDHPR